MLGECKLRLLDYLRRYRQQYPGSFHNSGDGIENLGTALPHCLNGSSRPSGSLRPRANSGRNIATVCERIKAVCEYRLDFRKGPWLVAVPFHADVEAPSQRIAIEAAVDVAEQMPASLVGQAPFPHRIVAKHDVPAFDGDIAEPADGGK